MSFSLKYKPTPAPEAPKFKKGTVVFMSIMALLFSFIIMKDIVLPAWAMIGAALIGGFSLLMMTANRPEVATYVLVAYLPFSKVLAGDFGGAAQALNFTNLLMFFIFVAWMSGRFADNEPLWVKTPLNWAIMLFASLACLSVVRGNYFGVEHLWIAVVEFKRWITPLLLFYLVLNTVKDRATIRNVIVIMMVTTTIVGLMAIYDYIEIGENTSLENSRVGGISEHSNTLAAFFNYYMFLPFGFFLMNMRRWKYWLLLIPFLIQFRGIMVTFSRGGYVAFAFALYAITFFRSKAMLVALLFLTGFAVLNPILLPSGIRFRMSQTIVKETSYTEIAGSGDAVEQLEGSLDGSTTSRIEIWKGAIQMIKENPIFGVGYGLFFPMIKDYWIGGFSIDAHNTYLIIAAEMGIPALLAFLLLIALVMYHTFILYKTTEDPFAKAFALGYLGGLFGLVMSNMFGSRLDSQEVSSYFWILSAVVMRLRILDMREHGLNWGAKANPLSMKPQEPKKISTAEGPSPKRNSHKLDSFWTEGQ